MTKKPNTKMLCACALMSAICAVFSQISLPLAFTPIVINLATLAVMIAGGLLGPVWGAVSLAVYVALGAAGLPVFSAFRGGIGHIAGPSGGYIIGYIFAAAATGLLTSRESGYLRLCLAMAAGTAVCYAFGTIWYMISTGTPLWPALLGCVFPFLPGDAVKTLLGAYLVKRLAPALKLR